MALIKVQDHDLNGVLAAARKDFGIFADLLFPDLHGGKPMVHAPYIDVITELMMSASEGGTLRFVLNMPPGYMKSMLVSVLFTAWRLGVDPGVKIICISYGDDLAHLLSRLVRKVMSQELYRWIFPDTIADKKSEDMIATTAGGYRYATAVGSDIAGFRADFILIDDPMQPDEAGSELAKQKLRDWYDGVVSQRLLDQRKGVVGLVMHRISPDDFSATLLEKGDFLHLSLPLVAEDEQEITGTDGRILLYRKPGEVLNPNRASAGDAQKIKRSTPSNVWDSQFQQRPLYGGGGLFAVERLTRWSGKSPYELIVHSWDIAATKDGDWTVGHSYGLTKNSVGDDVFDLIGITRVHVELPDVREMIVARNKLEKPALIVVDGNGIGLGVLQDLNQRGMRNVISSGHLTKANAKNAKQIRFYDALHRLYDGRVRFPATMPGLEIMFSECASFPDGKHDDHVDALSVVAGKFDRVVFLARQNIRCARV